MELSGWLPAFLLTIATETPVYLLALRRALGWPRALFVALLLNLLTHPLAWSTITRARDPFPRVFLTVEAGVFVTEAILILVLGRAAWARRRIGITEALAISFAANGLSAGLGLLL
jgi:hypothetical protein